MAKQSQSWKDLERAVAKALKGKRVLRGSDFSKSGVDVEVPDMPFKVDAKYRQKWGHHTFLAEVARKYCTEPDDMPVLVTKTPRQKGAVVVMDLDHFGLLVQVIRDMRAELARKKTG